MVEHRALVVTIPSATAAHVTGATLRVGDVLAALTDAGHRADVTHRPPSSGRWCTAVAVSYASAGHVAALRSLAPRTWLDAMDSWLLLNGSAVRHGHASYAARAVRDGWRLLRMPRPDLVTWISAADRASDGRSVRGDVRLVLPGRAEAPRLRTDPRRRAVVVGDWGYPPNRAGLEWLARKVLPLAQTTVDVYGRHAPALPRLRLHGYVPDPADVHRTGDVHLAPVLFGGGVKRKVVQPLLAGLPVIATSAGAHGLRRHPLLSVHDTPAAFAGALQDHLQRPASPAPPDPDALPDGDDSRAVAAWLRDCPGC